MTALFFFCFTVCISQTQYLDSLLNELKTAKEDTNKVLLLNYISQDIFKTDAKEAFQYAKASVNLSEKLNYERGKAIGIINMGRTYQLELNYKEALKCYLEGLTINQKRGNKLTIAKSYGDIAGVYGDLLDSDNAIVYQHKKINLLKDLADPKAVRSLAIAYNSLGMTYKDKLKYDSALKYIDLSEKINHTLNDSILLAACFFNKGLVYDEIPGFDEEALSWYQKTLDISLKIGHDSYLPNAYIGIADIYIKQNKFRDALQYAEKGINYANWTGNKIWVKYGYVSVIKAYEGLKDPVSQNRYLEKLLAFNDSIAKEETDSKLAEWRIKFETGEKEKENLILINEMQAKEIELNQTLSLVYGLGAAILLLGLIAWLVIRQNKLQSEQKAIQLEQKLLRSQMNPHFIFNCLQAIQNFTLKNDGKQATFYLSAFGALTRSVLENSRTELVSLKKEITLLEHYLNLQRLLHGQKFTYEITISPDLDVEYIEIPPMLAQPFIENSIEHGLKEINEGGLIKIIFAQTKQYMILEIIDNGKGISPAEIKEHRSLATTITKERIELYNKRNKTNASFTITDAFSSEQNKGVKVTIVLPLT